MKIGITGWWREIQRHSKRVHDTPNANDDDIARPAVPIFGGGVSPNEDNRSALINTPLHICLAERARPRAQHAPPVPTRWIFPDAPLVLDPAAPEDGRAPLNRYPHFIGVLTAKWNSIAVSTVSLPPTKPLKRFNSATVHLAPH